VLHFLFRHHRTCAPSPIGGLVAQEGGFISAYIKKRKNQCLVKISNQTLIDPDHIFKPGSDRDEHFSIRV
jgi:hypothetical protein